MGSGDVSRSQMSWWIVWKCQTISPVEPRKATVEFA